MKKKCLQCNKEFEKPKKYSPARWKQRVNCSVECQKKAQTTKVTIKCDVCNKKYIIHQFRLKCYKKHFCSRECKNKDEHSYELFKKNPKPFTKGSTRGEKNSNWKGGITPIYAQIRNCLRYSEWRLKVYMRDLFTCQDCSDSGVRLNADHIKPFSYILKKNNIKTLEQAENCEELWDTKNGKTLCKYCHQKTNTWGILANNYKEQ